MLVALIVLVACGPELESRDERLDAPMTFAFRAGPRPDGVILSIESDLRFFTLLPDGTGQRTRKRCYGAEEPGEEFAWRWEGDKVGFLSAESGEVVATLELAEDTCALHHYAVGDGGRMEDYYAGNHCRDDIRDNGHVGIECDWAPCDAVAEACAAASP